MRLLLLCVLVVFGGQAFGADPLAQCADIESSLERLDCYDRLAGKRARERKPEAPAEPKAPAVARPEAAPPETATPQPPPERRPAAPAETDRAEAAGPEGAEGWFGREHERSATEAVDRIEARIESVSKAPLGQQVMKLSNGQVWMENEPGRRRIAPGQSVVIRKLRFHYEMELPSQPDVAVRRVE